MDDNKVTISKVVTYLDDCNNKHLFFTNSAQDIRFLRTRFDVLSVAAVDNYEMTRYQNVTW